MEVYVPRVRRALQGPVVDDAALTDDQVEAITADAIADLILLTGGDWGHELAGTDGPPATAWEVNPGLSLAEQSLVATQAALTYFFHVLREAKSSERIAAEGREWEWSTSASMMRDQFRLLVDERNRALAALQSTSPVLARCVSILQVRDRVGSALLEPWVAGGLGGGGMELVP